MFSMGLNTTNHHPKRQGLNADQYERQKAMGTKSTSNNGESRIGCNNWDAVCEAAFHGGRRREVCRKVLTVGVKILRASGLLGDIRKYVRQGYEVRLADESGEAVRFYPCMSVDFKKMYVCARTLDGDFRDETLADKKAVVMHCGNAVDGEDLAKKAEKRYEQYKDETEEDAITPDTIVTCPNCGKRFRVGKRMGS